MATSHRGGREGRQLTEVRQELDGLLKDEEELGQRMDYLRYQVEEISLANLRPTEDHDLTLERDRGANAERIITLSDQAYRVLSDSSDRHESVMDLIAAGVQGPFRAGTTGPLVESAP